MCIMSCHVMSADRFYPCSGAEESQQSPSSSSSRSSGAGGVGAEESSIGGVINITLTPIWPGPWDQKLRSKLTTAQKEGLCSQASCEFRLSPLLLLLIERM